MVKDPIKDKNKGENNRNRSVHWLLLGVLGILFLLMGFFPSQKSTDSMNDEELRIATALSRIRGAGDTHVVIYTAETGSFASTGTPTGALIITQGADDITVHLQLLEAAETLLNLPLDSIRIYPMEDNP